MIDKIAFLCYNDFRKNVYRSKGANALFLKQFAHSLRYVGKADKNKNTKMKTATNTINLRIAGSAGTLRDFIKNDKRASALKLEDVIKELRQGKIDEKEAIFWLSALALSAEEKVKKHEELSLVDELTQIQNRRAFMHAITREISRLKDRNTIIEEILEEHMNLSLLMVDIDFFKKINDTHGHLTGDIVLKEIAQTLKKQVRGADSVYRYGGEEFVVLLTDTTRASAHEVAERINKAIHSSKFSIHDNKKEKIKATVSVGLTSIGAKEIAKTRSINKTINKLIHQADKALYRAKESGRNKVVVYR
jgi:diguanylate cyclase (GGDEF)-like protein